MKNHLSQTPLRRFLLPVTGLLLLLGSLAPAQAQTLASGTLSSLPAGGGFFDYTISLENTGATGIQTFWFAWVPGQNYMETSPTLTPLSSPAGWSASITHGGSSDGYAILWTTTTAPLAIGDTLSFSFQSVATPTAMAGNSAFYPATPIGTSFVYSGAPFSAGSSQFVVQSVPEPGTAVLGAVGIFFLLTTVLRRKSPSRR